MRKGERERRHAAVYYKLDREAKCSLGLTSNNNTHTHIRMLTWSKKVVLVLLLMLSEFKNYAQAMKNMRDVWFSHLPSRIARQDEQEENH